MRWSRHGSVDVVKPKGHFAGTKWVSDDEISYAGVHHRLRMAHGNASEHSCSTCGAQAANWAYDYKDPNERIQNGLRFSPKAEHYTPLCALCHKRFDNKQRELRAA